MRFLIAAVAFIFSAFPLSVLAQLRHEEPAWYLPVSDGCRLFVQEFGNGPETVVVLHGGWGADLIYLLKPFEGLEDRYHLVFYDQRGSLLSPCGVETISVQKHVEDLERLRVALKQEQLNIAAHSMGTFLAMEYQQQHPDRVRGLILIGSLPPRTPHSDAEKRLNQDRQVALKQLMNPARLEPELLQLGLDLKTARTWTPQQSSLAWHLSFAAANIYHLDRWRQVEGGGAFYKNDAAQAAAKSMSAEWDFTGALAARRCTTWVIDGDQDDVTDAAGKSFRMATDGIPGVHVVVLKDAGHLSWIDAPDDFSKTLRVALDDSTQCAGTPSRGTH